MEHYASVLQAPDALNGLGGTLTTPTLALGSKGTLALGFDFNVASLLDGSLFGGTSFSNSAGSLVIVNGATTTQGGTSSLSVASLTLGTAQGSGNYSLAENGKMSAGYEYIGYSGNGSFIQTGGTNTITTIYTDGLILGNKSMSTGVYNLSGSSLLSISSSSSGEIIGYSGTGIFIQLGGTNSSKYYVTLGYQAGSSGNYTLDGEALLSSAYEGVGYYGTGSFSQLGGSNIISTQLILGQVSGSTGTYNLDGGKLIAKSIVKGSGTAQFNFGGGTLQAGGTFSTSVSMTLTGTGGDATLDTAGYKVTLSGILSGSGGLKKIGAGTLILSGKNTYTGETSVDAGVLQITSDYTTGGKISVADGAGIVFGTPYSTSSAPESTAGQASSGTLLLESNFGSTAQGLCDLTGCSGGTAQSLSHPTVATSEIVAVPEPGTWVLLAASILGISVAGWRKSV